MKFDESIYSFMNCCSKGMSLIEIAIENNFTMEEVAKAFTFCKTSGFFSTEVPNLVSAIAGFIAGKYRTGEYFKRIGKINIDQLEHTIRIQKELREKGERPQFVELMIEFGYVTEADSKALLISLALKNT